LGAAVPLAYCLFIGLLIVVGFVGCPPDAYECPV
jgi:hypothetical protein